MLPGKNIDVERVEQQTAEFVTVRPRFKIYSRFLFSVLRAAIADIAPRAIVQVRPKTVASFSEKVIRKGWEFEDPARDFTDLCGGRIIVQTRSEHAAVCSFIESSFNVDWTNSVRVEERLDVNEFGYRSVHYVVSVSPGMFPTGPVPVEIPPEILPDDTHPMKVEIQVRTLLEHAWSEFSHQHAYKGTFVLPPVFQRELAVVAAILENADTILTGIINEIQKYLASYESYLTSDEIHEEMGIQEIIYKSAPDNYKIASKIGKLAISIGDWDKAINVLSSHVETEYQPIIRDLGIALCKHHKKSPDSIEYKEGQEYLRKAIELDPKDSDAISSLAGTWKNIDDTKAVELYKQAFEADPGNSYVLGNYLEYEIRNRNDASIITLLTQAINSSIERCAKQVEVGMNYPWAFYDMAKFYMFVKKPYMSMRAYLRAIQCSTALFMISTSYNSLKNLEEHLSTYEGFDWAERLMELACAVKFSDSEAVTCVTGRQTKDVKPVKGTVTIVAGSTSQAWASRLDRFRSIIIDAFRDYNGTIISGGTTSGVSGLVGDIQEANNFVETIGYVPENIPDIAEIDPRYVEIRRTPGDEFSPLQPIQYWTDIIASGIEVSQVKILGIGGRAISEFEYRLGITLGATVAIVGDGETYARLAAEDATWKTFDKLVVLPNDPFVLRAYVGTGIPELPDQLRLKIGRALHELYRQHEGILMPWSPQSLVNWDDLTEELQNSNLHAADHIVQKLNQIGCTLEPSDGDAPEPVKFSPTEIEIMAEMEHARWTVERLVQGWKLGPRKDYEDKTNPFIVPWSELDDNIRDIDRDIVRDLPPFMAQFGLHVKRRY